MPEHIKLGKAKVMDSTILNDGTRLYKKSRVRYWIERHGALENYYILYKEKIYHLSQLEFKRRLKIIIRGGELKM